MKKIFPIGCETDGAPAPTRSRISAHQLDHEGDGCEIIESECRIGWHFSAKILIAHGRFLPQLEKNAKEINAALWTLNQRVQGSSPCAPTNPINGLAENKSEHATPCDMSHGKCVARVNDAAERRRTN